MAADGQRPTGQFPAAKLAPDFYRYVAESAFGMIWSRPGLATRDRSLVTVAQLAALGRTEELRAHLVGARNVGLTREELVEVLMQTADLRRRPGRQRGAQGRRRGPRHRRRLTCRSEPTLRWPPAGRG